MKHLILFNYSHKESYVIWKISSSRTVFQSTNNFHFAIIKLTYNKKSLYLRQSFNLGRNSTPQRHTSTLENQWETAKVETYTYIGNGKLRDKAYRQPIFHISGHNCITCFRYPGGRGKCFPSAKGWQEKNTVSPFAAEAIVYLHFYYTRCHRSGKKGKGEKKTGRIRRFMDSRIEKFGESSLFWRASRKSWRNLNAMFILFRCWVCVFDVFDIRCLWVVFFFFGFLKWLFIVRWCEFGFSMTEMCFFFFIWGNFF